MMPTLGTIATVISSALFPWQLTTVLAISVAVYEPLVPLASGLLIDVVYYAGGTPWATILGVLGTVLAYVVRGRLSLSAFQ